MFARNHTAARRKAALLAGTALCALSAATPLLAQELPYIYIANARDDNVSIFDPASGTFLPGTISVGDDPQEVAVNGDQSRVYVPNSSAGTVSVIDTSDNSVIATVAVGNLPTEAVVRPDGARVYIANLDSDTVSVIDTATNTVVDTLAVGNGPSAVAVSPDGTHLYVTNSSDGSLTVVDTSDNLVVDTIVVGSGPYGLGVSPDGAHIYVANNLDHTVSVVDTATGTVSATIAVGVGPLGRIAVTPDGGRIYVANQGGDSVSVIDTATNTVTSTIGVENHPRGVAISLDGALVYVSNAYTGVATPDGTVSVIDTATDSVIETLDVGDYPRPPAMCGNGNALLGSGGTFVANTGGALGCTGAGPVFDGGTMEIAGETVESELPVLLDAAGGIVDTQDNTAIFGGVVSGEGQLVVEGTGTLVLSGANTFDGGTVLDGGTLRLEHDDALGTGDLTILGSTVDYDDGVDIGNDIDLQNDATLNVTAGSATQSGDIGETGGSYGITKTGAGTLVLSGTNTYTGATAVADGTLEISGGGTVGGASGEIGDGLGEDGTVRVDGAGSTWTNSGQLTIGGAGEGTLEISNGGVVSGTNGYIANQAGSSGDVAVDGASSEWNLSGNLAVGNSGDATLAISGGGAVSSVDGFVGYYAAGSSAVTVDGADSIWGNSGELNIGVWGGATLDIADGGAVTNTTGYIGRHATGDGEVTVSGADSIWTSSSTLYVGDSGTGTLTLAAGGTVEAASVTIASNASSTGTLNIGAAFDDHAVAAGTLDTASVVFGDGTGMLVFNHTNNDYAFDADIVGNGSLLVRSGITSLTGVNTYTGGTEIAGGTLKGTTTSLQGDIEFTSPSGQLHFDQSMDGTFSGSIAGGPTRGYLAKLAAGEAVFEDANIDVNFIHASGGTLVVDDGTVAADAIHSGYVSDAGHPVETASLHIRGGAQVTSDYGSVSSDDEDVGAEIRLTGAGTKWTVGAEDDWSDFYVSGNGGSLLSVSESAELEHFGGMNVRSAEDAEPGRLEVDGAGSLLSSTGDVSIGIGGIGHVAVTNGGRLETGGGSVGAGSSATGTVVISGAGSVWQTIGSEDWRIEQDIILGGISGDAAGTGHITIAEGGVLRLGTGGDGTIFAAHVEDSTATINIGGAEGEAAAGAGTFEAAEIDFGDADGGDGRLVFNHTALEHIFAPVVSGFGTVMQLAGITRLTGYSEYFEGDTHVTGGTLFVDDALGGTLHVSGGGRLGGTGNIGDVVVGSGGVFAPGNSVGAIIAYGDVAFGDGAVYEVEVNDGTGHAFINRPGVNNDYVDVLGALAIDSGASVSVAPENGTDDGSTYTPGLLYTILSANDGVTGVFGSVTASFAFLTPSLSYDANNVYLEFAVNYIDFGDVADTSNQRGVADTVESFGAGHPLYDEIIVMSEEDAQAAFDALSGEAHASSTGVFSGSAGIVRRTIFSRLFSRFGATRGFAAAQGYVPAAGDETPHGYTLWGELVRGWGETDGSASVAGIERHSTGFLGGVDREIGEGSRIGFALGYSRSDFDVSGRSSSGESDNVHLAGYAGTELGSVDLKAVLGYSYQMAESRRRVVVGGVIDDLSADYGAHTFQASGEASVDLEAGSVTLTPFAGLAVVHVETEAFTETGGGPSALSISSSGNTTGTSELGLRAAREAGSLTLFGSASWRHVFGDVEPLSRAAFASSPATTFSVRGTPLSEDVASLGGGVELLIAEETTLELSYRGEFASDSRDHGLKAKLRIDF